MLLESIGAIRIRTDVERKRLHGLQARDRSHSAIDAGLYDPADTSQTYQHMGALARQIAAAGYVAIVDAASLRRWQRDMFRDFSVEVGVPFAIVAVTASDATLRDRVAARSEGRKDASEADTSVLEHQQRTQEPPTADEQSSIVAIRSDAPPHDSQNVVAWQTLRARLASRPDRFHLCDAASCGIVRATCGNLRSHPATDRHFPPEAPPTIVST